MLYENLTWQYEQLSEEEKNALLIYKSRLGRAINALGNNEEEIIEIYNKYKQIVENPKNMFIKLSIFKDVSFKDISSFKDSLQKNLKIINQAIQKIYLPESTYVYRVISIPINENLHFISKGKLVSTSLDINECEKFLISNTKEQYKHFLYKIYLEKNALVGICPYAILFDEINDRIILTKRQDQKEIILLKDEYLFNNIGESVKELENGEDLNIINIKAELKEQSFIDVPKK